MSPGSTLQEFLDAARNKGATDETLVGLLRGRGWPEEDVHRALADNFEGRSGLKIPAFRQSGSAKDAFLYLLSFSTLAIWTIGVGSILFTLVDRWIDDPLGPRHYYGNSYYEMAYSLASVIVAFPVYLLLMRYMIRETGTHPEKLESAVRKWLTYIALLIAASVVVGDLISFLTYFLRGELTARFIAKTATVLVIAGEVFWYYSGSMRRRSASLKNSNE